jgi:hypothetical protein
VGNLALGVGTLSCGLDLVHINYHNRFTSIIITGDSRESGILYGGLAEGWRRTCFGLGFVDIRSSDMGPGEKFTGDSGAATGVASLLPACLAPGLVLLVKWRPLCFTRKSSVLCRTMGGYW